MSKFGLAVLLSVVSLTTLADDTMDDAFGEPSGSELFGKWRIAIGGAFNGGVRSHLKARNLPQPVNRAAAMILPSETEEAAWGRALNYEYDGGGYIKTDSQGGDVQTQNWSLPASAYRGNGKFELDNTYKKAVTGNPVQNHADLSEDESQFGVVAEISREIWSNEENEDNYRWGIDFVAEFAYFFQKNVYREHGDVTRDDKLIEGLIRTEVEDRAATYDYDVPPSSGMYGDGVYNAGAGHPSLRWSKIGTPENKGEQSSRTITSTAGYSASGDYRELEMLFMLRPWYEITDWWRIHANIGVGVSWGYFESDFYGSNGHYCENFDQWDAYGVAGLGTRLRYGRVDLSIDFLGRFLRDDMDINGRHVSGSLSRASWGFQVMAGYEF